MIFRFSQVNRFTRLTNISRTPPDFFTGSPWKNSDITLNLHDRCISKSFWGKCNANFGKRASKATVVYDDWLYLWETSYRSNIVLGRGVHNLADYGFNDKASLAQLKERLGDGHFQLQDGTMYYLSNETFCEVTPGEKQRIDPRTIWHLRGNNIYNLLLTERKFIGTCKG